MEILTGILSTYYDKFLEEFVKVNDEIRKLGGLYKTLGKNNNNTLYGRLGMDPKRLDETIYWGPESKKYVKIIESDGIKIGYSECEKSISNVFVAASITAKARVKLYKGFLEVLKLGGRLLYCDTDSIIAAFDRKSYRGILDKKFGEVHFDSKLSDTVIDDAVFALPKTYALKSKGLEVVKIKGFNVKPNFNKFKHCFYNNIEIETENVSFVKKDFQIMIKENYRKRTNLRSLSKRVWTKNLKDTNALVGNNHPS